MEPGNSVVVRSQVLGLGRLSTSQQLFEKFLIAQRSEYGRSLPGKVAQIAAHWRSMASDCADRGMRVELERLTHTLAGTAGTLGFVFTGHAAQALELLVQQAVRGGQDWAALSSDMERAIGLLQDSLPDAAAVPPDASTQTPANSPDNPKAAR